MEQEMCDSYQRFTPAHMKRSVKRLKTGKGVRNALKVHLKFGLKWPVFERTGFSLHMDYKTSTFFVLHCEFPPPNKMEHTQFLICLYQDLPY